MRIHLSIIRNISCGLLLGLLYLTPLNAASPASEHITIQSERIVWKGDLDSMVKPYAYVILPYLTQTNKDDSDGMKNIIYELRQFVFNSSELVVNEFDARGISEDEGLDTFNELNRRNGSSTEIIKGMFSEFEKKEYADLNVTQRFAIN